MNMNRNTFFLMLFVSTTLFQSCNSKSDVRDAARDSLNPQSNTTTATATDPTAMPSETPSGPTTTVSFSEERFNFGTVAAGEKVQHNFKIKNTGKEPLIITNASSSCGCTVPEWPKEPIAPGKSGEIKVVFDSNGKSGAQSKRVTIVSNTNPPESFLYLEGDVTGTTPQGN
jgi:hypothetical protein